MQGEVMYAQDGTWGEMGAVPQDGTVGLHRPTGAVPYLWCPGLGLVQTERIYSPQTGAAKQIGCHSYSTIQEKYTNSWPGGDTWVETS